MLRGNAVSCSVVGHLLAAVEGNRISQDKLCPANLCLEQSSTMLNHTFTENHSLCPNNMILHKLRAPTNADCESSRCYHK